MPEPARTIVYREEPEYRFDVDGKPFPWLVLVPRAEFRRMSGRFTLCTVTIQSIDPQTYADIDVTATSDRGYPVIAGVEFPWLLYDYTFHVAPDDRINLITTFVAEHVDTDGPIT